MRNAVLGASIVAIAAACALAARPARACGGCFHPPTPTEVTVVTDHRMAFSVSPQQTVLWDQIEYSGSPSDFAWVLPVMAGAQIQLSHDEFFAALDALTTPTITGPTPDCGSGGGGFSCIPTSGGASAADYSAAGGGSGVQVVSQGVVGPYDTVTVHSTDPNALYAWLNVNGYDVPESTRPVIDAYVTGGFDFLALRLAPGQGVQAMQPVRVVTPGAGLTLPLRMVSAGVGAQVGITLYVIGDGRYEAQNFSNAVVDDAQLVWLHTQSRSNYTELSEQLMAGDSGRTWLTEFASRVPFAGAQCSDGYAYGGGAATLAQAYFQSCACTGTGLLRDGSAADAGNDCSAFDDLSVAATGVDPGHTWITRLRAKLPSDVLPSGDLVLQASATQASVSNQHVASAYDDPTYSPCGPSGGSSACTMSNEPATLGGRWLVAASLALLTSSWVLRRRRPSRGTSPAPSRAARRASRPGS